VRSIDLNAGLLLVADNIFSVAKRLFSYTDTVEDQLVASMIQPATLVAVSGPIDDRLRSISRLKESYVAGETTIFVKAKVVSCRNARPSNCR